jgi:hypothetical protein
MAATWTILAGVIGVIALSVYLFGIPPEIKRKMERQALKTMGENKMSYMVKGVPHSYPARARQALTHRQTRSQKSPHPTRKMSSNSGTVSAMLPVV